MENNFQCDVSFNLGPKIEVFDTMSPVYLIELWEWFNDDWSLTFSDHNHKANHWYKHSKSFRTKWMVRVYAAENELPVLKYSHVYDETNKNVLLKFDYPMYDVEKAWFEKAIQFKNKFNCNLFIESKFSSRLEKINTENIFLVEKITNFDTFITANKIYATYDISRHEIQSNTWDFWESGEIFENHGHHYKSFHHPIDWIKLPNEHLINNILGI